MCCWGCEDWRRPWSKARADAGMRAEFVATPEEAGEWLRREIKPGDVVLLKASRGVRLERALEIVDRESTGRHSLTAAVIARSGHSLP